MGMKLDLKTAEGRIALYRFLLDQDIKGLVATETGCEITWPAYVAAVDSMKELIFAMLGYHDYDEACNMGMDDQVHDLSCDLVGRIFEWMREK